MKAKKGINKNTVYTALVRNGLEVMVVGGSSMAVFHKKGTPEQLKLDDKQHRYRVHRNVVGKDWRGRPRLNLNHVFSLQWFASGKIPKRRK